METSLELKTLALRGAQNLLSYLKNTSLDDEAGAEAIAATLCQLLTDLEQQYPGIAAHYGWQEHLSNPAGLQREDVLKLISLFAA